MDLDDELCLCFHVTKRKIINFLQVERPRQASQLAECGGAGTGCGWCRPYLRRLFRQAIAGQQVTGPLASAEQYAEMRARHRATRPGSPASDATSADPAAEKPAGESP
jgi:NAD(P)H-nitrite reductase large subunit